MRLKIGVACLACFAVVVCIAAGFAARPVEAQTQAANIRLPGLAATVSSGLRVTRIAAASEVPAEFYGVDYPAGSVPSISTKGFLTITNGVTWVAVWAPGQWSRIEVLP